jgi:hypothetical protein
MLAGENQPGREILQIREIREIREPKAAPAFTFLFCFQSITNGTRVAI